MTKTLRDFKIELRNDSVGQHTTTCPNCRDKRKKKNAPCLSVLVGADNTVWNCHHCGWSGSLHTGIERRGGDDHWRPAEWVRPKLLADNQWNERAKQFFHGRKIFDETLARNKIHVQHDVWIPQMEELHDAIAFPFFRLGECVNVKYRGPHKHFVLVKGAERIFYGLDDVITGKDTGEFGAREWAIIVEGEMDKLAMEEVGYTNVLSPPNGAPSLEAKNLEHFYDFIENSNVKLADGKKLIDTISRFVIAVDSDKAGQALEAELVRRLGPERCSIVTWPKREDGSRHKDANDVLIALGAQAVREAVLSAKPMPIAGVFRVEDIDEPINRYYEEGLPPGLSAGFGKSFITEAGKEIYTLQMGTITLIGGIPQHGKSSFTEQMMVHTAKEYGWNWAVFAPETQPLELQAASLMEKWAGRPFARGFQQRMSPADLVDAKDFVNRHFWFLLSEVELFTVRDILDRFDHLVRHHGVKAVLIDPWNGVHHERRRDETSDQYLQRSIQIIRQWARTRNVWTGITAHPTKMEKVRGKDPVPTPYDVKGGSEWFDMMDFAMTVWRDVVDETKPTQVHIQKVKFRHLGALGVAHLNYDKPTGMLQDSGEYADSVKIKALNKDERSTYNRPPAEHEPPWWLEK